MTLSGLFENLHRLELHVTLQMTLKAFELLVRINYFVHRRLVFIEHRLLIVFNLLFFNYRAISTNLLHYSRELLYFNKLINVPLNFLYAFRLMRKKPPISLPQHTANAPPINLNRHFLLKMHAALRFGGHGGLLLAVGVQGRLGARNLVQICGI